MASAGLRGPDHRDGLFFPGGKRTTHSMMLPLIVGSTPKPIENPLNKSYVVRRVKLKSIEHVRQHSGAVWTKTKAETWCRKRKENLLLCKEKGEYKDGVLT